MFKYAKEYILRSSLYDYWTTYKAAMQEKCFNKQLQYTCEKHYDKNTLLHAISQIKHNRKKLSGCPRVVAFGHDSWEKYGLWKTLGRISDFHFVLTGSSNGKWNAECRKAAGQALLDTVDALEQDKSVDLVFMYCDSCFLDPIMLNQLSERRIWTVLMGLDDKHKFQPRREFGMEIGQSRVAPLVDLYWTTWKAGLQLLWQTGARPIYLAEGADPEFHRPLDLEKDIDVLFIGQCYGKRQSFIRYIRERGFRVEAYGNGWENGFVSFEKSIELIARAKVVLGIGGVGHMLSVQHLKGRDFEVPMCGAVYLTSYNPELADWFDIGKEILCYSSPQNCAEMLSWLLPAEEEQDRIRSTALEGSLKKHTWETRLNTIFSLLHS